MASVSYPGGLSQLQLDSNDADIQYGLPVGTTFAVAGTESSYGQNVGSIGNIFQVQPSTASNPGFGLGTLDGNNPYDAASYLSAIYNGPANGNVANAIALYQNGPNSGNLNPQYSSSSPDAEFLSGQSTGGSGGTGDPLLDPNNINQNFNTNINGGGSAGQSGYSTGATQAAIGSALQNSSGSWGEYFVRGVVVLLGIIFVTVGLVMLGNKQAKTIVQVVSKTVKAT